jgi:hypothetical protein
MHGHIRHVILVAKFASFINRRDAAGYPIQTIAEWIMPSLFRFLLVVALLVAGGYGALYALAYHTNPQTRQITVIIPPNQLNKHR